MMFPLQVNHDSGIGLEDGGSMLVFNIQPVVPFNVAPEWNLITRTIIPVFSQSDLAPGSGTQTGPGDVNMSLFFFPKKPTDGGLVWGVGPA